MVCSVRGFFPEPGVLLDVRMLLSFISGVEIEDFEKLVKYLTACVHTARRNVRGASFCARETLKEKPQKIHPCTESNKGEMIIAYAPNSTISNLLFDQLLQT